MDAYIGEIRLFPFVFVPEGWLACNGQRVLIARYQALLAVIGYAYGPYSNTDFSLPNLQGQTAMGAGTGPGLTPRTLAKSVGVNGETATLSSNQMPVHTHVLNGSYQNDTGVVLMPAPSAGSWFTYPEYTQGTDAFYSNNLLSGGTATTTLAANALMPTGGAQAHPNLQPYLPLQWCICYLGEFPMRP